MDNNTNFGQYGRIFQEKVIQALLLDAKWAEQLAEVVDASYFDLKYLIFLAERYFAYARKYKVFPSLALLLTIIKDELKIGVDASLRDQIIEYLTRIKASPDLGDLEYVKEKSLDFCRKQALKNALEVAIDQIASGKYEQIVETIKKATMVGTTPDVGHDFQLDFDSRFDSIKRDPVPLGLPDLDKKEVFNGGLGRGELAVIIGATGAGKSHFLVNIGANALKNGYNVIYYTLELSETMIGIRFDSNFCEISSTDVPVSKDVIAGKYKDMKLGKLFVKGFPPNTMTVQMMRAHLERLKMTKGVVPDVIIVDYADIARSSRQFDSLRHELNLVYTELRGLAVETNTALWTASQSNKEGADSEVIDMTNMSESYGKAFIADVVMSISRRSVEKAAGVGRIYVAKNRAGKDGLLFHTKIDTACSRFTLTGSAPMINESRARDDDHLRQQLRRKLKEFNQDPVFKSQTKEDQGTTNEVG